MAISATHSEAARRNGALTHGPLTPESKARSSQNARKHGFLAATTTLSCEDQTALDQLSVAFYDEYNPVTPTESRYVREMVDAEWRLQRVRAHITSIQQTRMNKISENPNMDDAAEAFRQLAEEGPSLSLLQRYETQFRRQFDKSLEMLTELRFRRQSDPEKIRRQVQAEQMRMLEAYVNAPMPGEREEFEPEDEIEEDEPQSRAAKSSSINFPNEPSASAPKSAAAPTSSFARLANLFKG